jgi:hypothetical protein
MDDIQYIAGIDSGSDLFDFDLAAGSGTAGHAQEASVRLNSDQANATPQPLPCLHLNLPEYHVDQTWLFEPLPLPFRSPDPQNGYQLLQTQICPSTILPTQDAYSRNMSAYTLSPLDDISQIELYSEPRTSAAVNVQRLNEDNTASDTRRISTRQKSSSGDKKIPGCFNFQLSHPSAVTKSSGENRGRKRSKNRNKIPCMRCRDQKLEVSSDPITITISQSALIN